VPRLTQAMACVTNGGGVSVGSRANPASDCHRAAPLLWLRHVQARTIMPHQAALYGIRKGYARDIASATRINPKSVNTTRRLADADPARKLSPSLLGSSAHAITAQCLKKADARSSRTCVQQGRATAFRGGQRRQGIPTNPRPRTSPKRITNVRPIVQRLANANGPDTIAQRAQSASTVTEFAGFVSGGFRCRPNLEPPQCSLENAKRVALSGKPIRRLAAASGRQTGRLIDRWPQKRGECPAAHNHSTDAKARLESPPPDTPPKGGGRARFKAGGEFFSATRTGHKITGRQYAAFDWALGDEGAR